MSCAWSWALALPFALCPLLYAAEAPPELIAPVNDFAHVIDARSAAQIDRLSRALKAASGDVVVVATVPTIEPYGDIREYAVKMFENHGRGIGDKGKDNGLLILLAIKERKVWVEVGYGLEQWITDRFSGETSRQYMVPQFRNGAYGLGLLAGTARIVEPDRGRPAGQARRASPASAKPSRAAGRSGRCCRFSSSSPSSSSAASAAAAAAAASRSGPWGRGADGRAAWARLAAGAAAASAGASAAGSGDTAAGGGFGGFGGGGSGGGGGGAGW